MQNVRIIGSHIDTGESLRNYVETNIKKVVEKYFENAISSDIHISKTGNFFRVVIVVNEGVRHGLRIKSESEAGDVYNSFNEALNKIEKQLKKYKNKIKNYRKREKGLKSLSDIDSNYLATKFVIPSLDDLDNLENEQEEKVKIIDEKSTEIEELSVNEAIMKMDLQNLPALVFENSDTKKINVVYHRKDGNISWISIN